MPSGSAATWLPVAGTHVYSIPDGVRTAYAFSVASLTQDLGFPVEVGSGSGNIRVRLSNTTSATQSLFDAVSVQTLDPITGDIPEPSALILAVLGLAALAAKRFRP